MVEYGLTMVVAYIVLRRTFVPFPIFASPPLNLVDISLVSLTALSVSPFDTVSMSSNIFLAAGSCDLPIKRFLFVR